MRDTQQSKVYRAEESVVQWENQFGSNAATQQYVDRIIGDRWFRARWKLSRITVRGGRGHRGAAYGGFITISPAGRNPMVVLHEIAHEVLGGPYMRDEIAPHGPEFCATFLLLVEHYVDAATAESLREAYLKHGVAFRGGRPDLVPDGPRYTVPTKAQEAKERAARVNQEPVRREYVSAARTLRWLIRAGEFGDSGTVSRTRALAVARKIEGRTESVSR